MSWFNGMCTSINAHPWNWVNMDLTATAQNAYAWRRGLTSSCSSLTLLIQQEVQRQSGDRSKTGTPNYMFTFWKWELWTSTQTSLADDCLWVFQLFDYGSVALRKKTGCIVSLASVKLLTSRHCRTDPQACCCVSLVALANQWEHRLVKDNGRWRLHDAELW